MKGVCSKRKDFAPTGNTVFHFRVYSFYRRQALEVNILSETAIDSMG